MHNRCWHCHVANLMTFKLTLCLVFPFVQETEHIDLTEVVWMETFDPNRYVFYSRQYFPKPSLFSVTKFSETETLRKLAKVLKPKCHTLDRGRLNGDV